MDHDVQSGDEITLEEMRLKREEPIGDVIAEQRFIGVDPSGFRRELIVQIGRPYQNEHGHWSCPSALYGLYQRFSDLQGEGAVDALWFGMQMPWMMLIDYVQSGRGKLYWPSKGEEPEEEVPVEMLQVQVVASEDRQKLWDALKQRSSGQALE